MRQRGQMLVTAVVLIVVVALMVATLGFLYVSGQRSSTLHSQSEDAYFAARSGIEYASFQFGPGTGCTSLAYSNITVGTGTGGNVLSKFTTTPTAYVLGPTTTTDNPLSASATTINVGSTTGYAPHGRIWINAEQINYTGLTATSFTGATRGVGGSTATTHNSGSRVSQNQCLVKSTGTSGSATRIVEAGVARSTNRERAMAVYAKGTAASGAGFDQNVYYRLWDSVNNAWGAEQTSTQQVANNATPMYFVLKFARTRNEAILGTLDGLGNLYIHVWNGATNTWSTPAGGGPLQAGISTTYRGFQIEYEFQNDRAIIVYSNGAAANPKYAIWDGSTLNTAPVAGGFIHNSLGLANYVTAGVIRWFRLAANRANGSNEIIMMTLDSNRDLWGARWTGSAWAKMEAGAAATWDANATDANIREALDVAYESVSNSALLAWGSSTTRQVNWRTWTPSTATLSGITNTRFGVYGGAYVSAIFDWLRLYPRPDADDIMAVFQDASSQLITNRWNGAGWDTRTPQDTPVDNAANRSFDFGWQTLPTSFGQGWLVWGSGSASMVSTKSFTAPAAWSAATNILDNVRLTQIGVLPLTGTGLAGLYGSSNAALANRITEAIYALPGATTWTTPATTLWGGSTNNIQTGERIYPGISPTGSIILEQEELYP